jgi:hypothetical protein
MGVRSFSLRPSAGEGDLTGLLVAWGQRDRATDSEARHSFLMT